MTSRYAKGVLALLTLVAAARTQMVAAQDAPLGERVSLQSRVLNESRAFLLYLPPEYRDSTRRFPVLYVLDGDALFLNAAAAARALQQDALMPPVIIVGVGNTNRERDFTTVPTHPEATPNGLGAIGGATRFAQFVREELIPSVDRRYRTVPSRMLVGHSLGGLAAMHLLATSPTTFRGYVTLEPSLWWDRRAVADSVIRTIRNSPSLTGRLVAVERGTDDGWRPDSARLIDARPPAFASTFVHVAGVSHQQLPYRGLYEGFRALFDGYASVAATDPAKASLPALEARYAALSLQLGYAVDIPLSALLDAAQRRLEGRSARDAVTILEFAARAYPRDPRVPARLETARRALKAPAASGYVAFVSITAPNAARLAGDWTEASPADGSAPPRRVRHRFEVRGDSLMHSAVVFFSADTTERFAISPMPVSIIGDTISWERTNRAGGGYVTRLVWSSAGDLVGDERGIDLPTPPPGIVNRPVPVRLTRSVP